MRRMQEDHRTETTYHRGCTRVTDCRRNDGGIGRRRCECPRGIVSTDRRASDSLEEIWADGSTTTAYSKSGQSTPESNTRLKLLVARLGVWGTSSCQGVGAWNEPSPGWADIG